MSPYSSQHLSAYTPARVPRQKVSSIYETIAVTTSVSKCRVSNNAHPDSIPIEQYQKMTDKEYLKSLRIPTDRDPLRVLLSSCLIGTLCGADGSSYGNYPHIIALANRPNVQITSFCPEDYSFGTPREIPDISGGNGADVLDGKASVITETGLDITEGMLRAARKMLQVAQESNIELAIMMDVSAACGSQVIYKGHRLSKNPQYQIGMGVCAELLNRNRFKIISQRDFKSLDILLSKIDSSHISDTGASDHDETDWYKEYFKA